MVVFNEKNKNIIIITATSPPERMVVGEYAEYATSKETPR